MILTFLSLGLFAQNNFNPEQNPVAKKISNEIELIVNQETLLLSATTANSEISTLEDFNMLSCGSNNLIVTKGKLNSGHSISLGIRLESSDGINFFATGTGITCTGHCCKQCIIVCIDSTEGCDCNAVSTSTGCNGGTEARCDHSISSELLLAAVNE